MRNSLKIGDIYDVIPASDKCIEKGIMSIMLDPVPGQYLDSAMGCTMFVMCSEGRFSITINGEYICGTSGDTITILSKNMVKNLTFEPGFKGMVLLMEREFNLTIITSNALPVAKKFKTPRLAHVPEEQLSLLSSFYWVCRNIIGRDSDNKAESLRMLLRSIFMVSHGSEAESTHQARSGIISDSFIHLVESDRSCKLSVESIAKMMNLTSSHLARTVKHETGKTPSEWIQSHRLDKAKSLLGSADVKISVEDTGRQCGFDSTSSFCHFFKSKVGVTPLEFRNSTVS